MKRDPRPYYNTFSKVPIKTFRSLMLLFSRNGTASTSWEPVKLENVRQITSMKREAGYKP